MRFWALLSEKEKAFLKSLMPAEWNPDKPEPDWEDSETVDKIMREPPKPAAPAAPKGELLVDTQHKDTTPKQGCQEKPVSPDKHVSAIGETKPPEMKRYLAAAKVTIPTYIPKFAPKGHCDWCGKKLIGRSTRFCPPIKVCPKCSVQLDKRGGCPQCGTWWPHGSDCRRLFYTWWYSIAAFKRAVFIRDNFTCQSCGHHEVYEESPWLPATGYLHCDHIIPVSKGGKTEIDNLQTLCQRCNLRKGNKDTAKQKIMVGQLELKPVPPEKKRRRRAPKA